MSYPPTTNRLLTAEDLYEIPGDGRGYELVRGVLVVSEPPGFTHGDLTTQILTLLNAYVRQRRLGKVVGEVGYVLERGPDTVRGPDASFVRSERVPTGAAADKFVEGAPDLVVEIRSPSDRPGEIADKVAEYLGKGVSIVWVVDPRRRVVMVHTPDGHTRLLRDGDTIAGGDVLPGFAAPVSELLPDL